MVRIMTLAAIALGVPACAAPPTPSVAAAVAPQSSSVAAAADPQEVCKFVITAQPGAKPFQMCLTRSEWAQRDAIASRDANRIECRYQDVPGSRFHSKKICQPASAWAEHQRLEREALEAVQRNVCVRGGGC